MKKFYDLPLLASQYAHRGRYEISEHDVEQLPDGRVILFDEKVFHPEKIFDVTEDGSLKRDGEPVNDADADRLYDYGY